MTDSVEFKNALSRAENEMTLFVAAVAREAERKAALDALEDTELHALATDDSLEHSDLRTIMNKDLYDEMRLTLRMFITDLYPYDRVGSENTLADELITILTPFFHTVHDPDETL
jgi:hypothetical protein